MSDTLYYDKKYTEAGYVWGKKPSEIAKIAAKQLKGKSYKNVLDVGCGYGRDSLFLSKNLNCKVTGIDLSEQAILLGKEFVKNYPNVKLLQKDFLNLEGSFDVIVVSHVFHLLHPQQRKPFISQIYNLLAQNGTFFLSTHSINDKAEYGKGKVVENEKNSFISETYVHFSTNEEIEEEYSNFKIELTEHSFLEKRVGGDHYHTTWVIIGKKK